MILITGKMVPVTWCRSLSHMRLTSSPLQKMNLAQHFLLSTSSSQRLREIVVTEGEKEIVVEGVSVPSPRQGKVVNPPVPGPGCHEKVCHPLCRLPFVNEIKHTGKSPYPRINKLAKFSNNLANTYANLQASVTLFAHVKAT